LRPNVGFDFSAQLLPIYENTRKIVFSFFRLFFQRITNWAAQPIFEGRL
jgi:hypothetical protein